jgi:hypothetical protein
MSALTLIIKALSFDDDAVNSNPAQKGIDRGRTLSGLTVENDETLKVMVDPGASVTVFDGSRTLGHDNTTDLQLTLSPLDPNRYRVTCTSGPSPAFRTNRNLATSGKNVQWQVNANQTATLTITAYSPPWSVGDTLFVPGASTGDSPSAFNALNEGYWTILAASGNQATLARFPGEVFSGFTETVTSPDNNALQAFSAAGVQVGDTIDISAGFSVTAQHSYDVVAVNPNWVEFISTAPLGEEVAQPGQAGFVIYDAAKRFLYIETDQEVVVQVNGDTGNYNRVEPVLPGDKKFVGPYMKWGHAWKLVLVSRSTARANVTVCAAE